MSHVDIASKIWNDSREPFKYHSRVLTFFLIVSVSLYFLLILHVVFEQMSILQFLFV